MSLAKEIPNERLPSWFVNDLLGPFQTGISSAFIVSGDINCLVTDPEETGEPPKSYIKLKEFWRKVLKDNKIVIFYNIALGVRFLKPEMEAEFKKAAGLLEQNQPAGAVDPAVANARADLASRRPLPTEPAVCLDLIDQVLRTKKDVAVVVDSAHLIASAGNGGLSPSILDRINMERIKNWSQSETIRSNRNIILLLTHQASKISEELRISGNDMGIVFVSKPSLDERRVFIGNSIEGTADQADTLNRLRILDARLSKQKRESDRQYIVDQIEKFKKQLESSPQLYTVSSDLDVNTFTVASQGLSLDQIRKLLIESKNSGLPLSLGTVKERKYKMLSGEYDDVMEVVNPLRGLEDIGGMEYLKRFFEFILDAIKRGDIRRVPMGITLMGPPGTGKTAFIEALAKGAGFEFIKVKNVRSMWLGGTEERMEKLINGLWSLAPVVVNNDEADLSEADRNSPKGDSGTSERLMRAWMTLLSDPKIRGKIIVINCTNRPDRLDPALKRSGRSDKRILVPMPSLEEIPAIFEVMFRRYGIKTSIGDFTEYAHMVDGRSGADIETIALSALDFAGRNGQDDDEIVVNGPALETAIEDSIPSASQPEIDEMTMMGLLESSSRELLPPHIKKIVSDIMDRNLVSNLSGMIEQIRARKIVNI